MTFFRVHVLDVTGRHALSVEATSADEAAAIARDNGLGVARTILKIKLDRAEHPRAPRLARHRSRGASPLPSSPAAPGAAR